MPRQKRTKLSPAIISNLFKVYYEANANDLENGLTWYSSAHSVALRLSSRYNITLEQSCGVIAALSPGYQWERNVQDAELFISYYNAGNRGKNLPNVGTYGRKNRNKAIEILRGKNPLDVLGGPKVRSFYTNIFNPSDSQAVTVDRHAKSAAYGIADKSTSLVREYEYEYLARHFRHCASKLAILPCQFQAVCWVTWKRLKDS